MSDPDPGGPPREAVARLFSRYGDRIYGLGLRLCGDEQTADDLVQETFMRALRSWDRFEGRSKSSTWLHTIAVRACGRMKRRRAGQPARMESLDRLLPDSGAPIVQVPSGDDPSAAASRGEVVEAVREAIADLPPDFRFPLVLKDVFDFSLREIGEVLDVKPETVKTRLHRARLRVRDRFADALPARPGPPPDHSREECLVLLKAKQEALDRGAPFPVPEQEMCRRCRSMFATLDLGVEACRSLGEGRMPEELRRAVERALAGAPADPDRASTASDRSPAAPDRPASDPSGTGRPDRDTEASRSGGAGGEKGQV